MNQCLVQLENTEIYWNNVFLYKNSRRCKNSPYPWGPTQPPPWICFHQNYGWKLLANSCKKIAMLSLIFITWWMEMLGVVLTLCPHTLRVKLNYLYTLIASCTQWPYIIMLLLCILYYILIVLVYIQKAYVVSAICLLKKSEEFLFTKMKSENKGFWLVEKSAKAQSAFLSVFKDIISLLIYELDS